MFLNLYKDVKSLICVYNFYSIFIYTVQKLDIFFMSNKNIAQVILMQILNRNENQVLYTLKNKLCKTGML